MSESAKQLRAALEGTVRFIESLKKDAPDADYWDRRGPYLYDEAAEELTAAWDALGNTGDEIAHLRAGLTQIAADHCGRADDAGRLARIARDTLEAE